MKPHAGQSDGEQRLERSVRAVEQQGLARSHFLRRGGIRPRAMPRPAHERRRRSAAPEQAIPHGGPQRKGAGQRHPFHPASRAGHRVMQGTDVVAASGEPRGQRHTFHSRFLPIDIELSFARTTPCRTCCAAATSRCAVRPSRGWRHSCSVIPQLSALEPRDMCGIAGIVYRQRERPVPESLLRRLCSAMRHRGPDDEGLYLHGAVGLGMRRLSIIDLSGGRQPIFTEDGSKVIVFNGEIYNSQDLRRGLVARGHTIRSAGDTETVLHLYEERGPDCVSPLRGMFAFAIWDASTETLLLARDRFGIKPLYVVTAPWGIAFASELKALHAAGLTSRALDWEALDMFVQLGYIPAPASPFQDVRKLEPGHTLAWSATGESVVRQYWHLPRELAPRPAAPEARIREWVDESVATHLVSDVPVAVFLSGGLDSSSVVASMSLAGERPHAFTARYGGSGQDGADETGLARQLARRYAIDLTVVDIQPDIRHIFEPIVWALDEPHADDSAIPTWLLSQAVGREYKVALTGIGGDELFGGYPRHIGLPLAEVYRKLPAGLRRLASTAAHLLPEPRAATLGVDRVKRFLRSGNGDLADRFLSFMSRLAQGERQGLYTPGLQATITGQAARDRFRSLCAEEVCPPGLSAGLYHA